MMFPYSFFVSYKFKEKIYLKETIKNEYFNWKKHS